MLILCALLNIFRNPNCSSHKKRRAASSDRTALMSRALVDCIRVLKAYDSYSDSRTWHLTQADRRRSHRDCDRIGVLLAKIWCGLFFTYRTWVCAAGAKERPGSDRRRP